MNHFFRFLPALILLFGTLSSRPVQAEGFDTKKPMPTPEAMQALLWKYGELHDCKLQGVMRTKDNKYPMIMRTRGRLMQFEFTTQPLQIRVEITPGGSIIQRRSKSSDKWQTLSAQQRLERVLDSDVYYEDLGIEFTRWDDVRPLGVDTLLTFETWAYEARPSQPSTYTKARFWISSKFVALLRVDAYDKNNKVIKRVEVHDVMEIGELYSIKSMMIATMIPDRDISRSRTFLDIEKGSKGSGLEE